VAQYWLQIVAHFALQFNRQAFINIQTIADQMTEGPEIMYITLGTSTTSLTINDTSVTLVGVFDNGGGDGGGGGGGGAGGD
jgi:hypothetical protein